VLLAAVAAVAPLCSSYAGTGLSWDDVTRNALGLGRWFEFC
jgi:uncharacterized protein YfiM (DUF2279 family)